MNLAPETSRLARVLEPDNGAGRSVIEFRVTDSGIGIPPEAMPRYSKPHSRAPCRMGP